MWLDFFMKYGGTGSPRASVSVAKVEADSPVVTDRVTFTALCWPKHPADSRGGGHHLLMEN
jgi:hypothetical protein